MGDQAFRRSGVLVLRWSGALAIAALLVGCGAGGSGTTRVPEPITEANQAQFSGDALFLATRAATGPWLSAPAARQFDKDLAAIRALNTRITDIHVFGVTPDGTFLDPILRDVYVNVKKTAPWLAAWRAGTLVSGDANVDSVLQQFHAASVQTFIDWDDGTTSFRVRFAPPLKTSAVAGQLVKTTTQFTYAEGDSMGGDGDDITFEQAGGDRKYTFSVGWGDCPAGCTAKHYWEFTVHPDGTIAVREFGTPLDAGGGPGRSATILTTQHSTQRPNDPTTQRPTHQ